MGTLGTTGTTNTHEGFRSPQSLHVDGDTGDKIEIDGNLSPMSPQEKVGWGLTRVSTGGAVPTVPLVPTKKTRSFINSRRNRATMLKEPLERISTPPP